jgi:hypothetical protein
MDLLLNRASHVCDVEEVFPGDCRGAVYEMLLYSSNFTCGSASSAKVPSNDLS